MDLQLGSLDLPVLMVFCVLNEISEPEQIKQTGVWVNQQDIKLNGGGGVKFNKEKSAISKYKLYNFSAWDK